MLSAHLDHSQPGTKQRECDREEGQKNKKNTSQQFPCIQKKVTVTVFM